MAEPDQRLYFLLQRAAHRLRTDADRRCLPAAGVTTAQIGALFAVRDRPGITQRQLAQILGLGEPAITSMVSRLAKAGLVTKDTHPSQHRAVVLKLTSAGEESLDAARPEIDRFNTQVRDLLGEEGFDRAVEALHTLAHWKT